MNIFQRNKIIPVISLLLVFGFLPIILISNFLSASTRTPQINTQEEAHKIVTTCKNSSHQDTCYANAFTHILSNTSLNYTLAVLSEVQKNDKATNGCHFIAHSIAMKAVEKDPAHWQDLLGRLPTHECTGGFIMGVLEGHKMQSPEFQVNNQTIATICHTIRADFKTEASELTCYHAMGHLLLVDTKGNIKSAVKYCTHMSESFSYECLAGVFMEQEYKHNLAASGREDEIPWDINFLHTQKQLCQKQTGLAAKACWRELSHIFVELSHNNIQAIFDQCQEAPNEAFQEACYHHSVSIITLTQNAHSEFFKHACHPYSFDAQKYNTCNQIVIDSLMDSSQHSFKSAKNYCHRLDATYRDTCLVYLRGKQLLQTLSRS